MIDSSPNRPLRVFLCHSSGDKPAVRELYRRLLAEGFAPWLDEEDLLPGQDWRAEIPKAVRNADVVIVCLSRGSINKAGYVQKEIKFALDVADEQPDGAIFLIPLKLEECDVPERLSRWQWVNHFKANGYERLLRSLRHRAEGLGLSQSATASAGVPIPQSPPTKSAPASSVSGGINFAANTATIGGDVTGRDKIIQAGTYIEHVTVIQSPPSQSDVFTDKAIGDGASKRGTGLAALAEAGATAAELAMRAEAVRVEEQRKQKAREDLAKAAFGELTTMGRMLFERIREAVPTANYPGDSLHVMRIQFGAASLSIANLFSGTAISADAFKESRWDVIAGATITVEQKTARPYEWSASLWFTNLGRDEKYRWWEVLYMTSPLLARRQAYEPYALTDLTKADLAASPVMDVYQLAAKPRPIDAESIDEFCDRWADLLAKAYQGKLEIPRSLPLS